MPKLALLLSLLLVTALAAHSQQSDVILLPDASWQLHFGDDPRCGTVSGTGCTPQSFNPTDLPRVPQVWERTVVRLPDQLRKPQQLGLLMEDQSCFYQVFINGHLIGSRGDLQKIRGPYNSRAVFSFSSTLAENGSLVISIRASVLLESLAGSLAPPFVPMLGRLEPIQGRFAENTADHFRAQWQHYLCFLLVFFIGLFFLLLYFLDRALPENLWLGLLLCGSSSIRFLEFASFVNLGLNSVPADLLYFFDGVLVIISTIEFGFSVIKRQVWPFFRLLQFVSALNLIPFFAYLPFSYSAQGTLFELIHLSFPPINICNVLSSFALLVPLRFCLKNPLPEMRWIGAALLFLSFEDVNRQLSHLRAWGVPYIPVLPQNISIGSLAFDVRALAYFLFATVMLVAMTVRFRRIQARNLLVEADLEAARTVQRLLVPSQAPETPGFTIESVYLPAQEVGGDFFHVAPAPDGSVLLVVGDVSGKGLSAAMTVSAIICVLRSTSSRDASEVLTELNRVLYGFISGFATCCVALVTTEGQLTLANAGHLSPYRNGGELTLSSSLPLGLTHDATYRSEHSRLEPGDHLTFVSDGVVESANGTGELFGFARTAEISGQSARRIAESAQRFGWGAQVDDITVLTVHRVGLQG